MAENTDFYCVVEIPQSLISFFRLKVTTFTCLQSGDYDYCKAAKKVVNLDGIST
jgi:hypothetical protein